MNIAQERLGYTLISELVVEGVGLLLEVGLDILCEVFSSEEEKKENEEENKNEQ